MLLQWTQFKEKNKGGKEGVGEFVQLLGLRTLFTKQFKINKRKKMETRVVIRGDDEPTAHTPPPHPQPMCFLEPSRGVGAWILCCIATIMFDSPSMLAWGQENCQMAQA